VDNSFQQKLNHSCGSFSTDLFKKPKQLKKKMIHSAILSGKTGKK